MTEEPIKPEGARLVLPNGTEVPLELEYVGLRIMPSQQDPGAHVALHVWEVIAEAPLPVRRGTRFKITTMPPRTTIVFPAGIEP